METEEFVASVQQVRLIAPLIDGIELQQVLEAIERYESVGMMFCSPAEFQAALRGYAKLKRILRPLIKAREEVKAIRLAELS